jgi:3-mercaptopyruvate sulfurtransferase SseA
LFTLKLMGYDKVANYDASFGEWGNVEGFPIAR